MFGKITRTILIILAILATVYFLFWIPLSDMVGTNLAPSGELVFPSTTKTILATSTKLPESTSAIARTPELIALTVKAATGVNFRACASMICSGNALAGGTHLTWKGVCATSKDGIVWAQVFKPDGEIGWMSAAWLSGGVCK